MLTDEGKSFYTQLYCVAFIRKKSKGICGILEDDGFKVVMNGEEGVDYLPRQECVFLEKFSKYAGCRGEKVDF